jgi:hypothetical protein
MRTYEVWYEDINGEHYLGVAKAYSAQGAIDLVWEDLYDQQISKPQLKAYDVVTLFAQE